VKQIYVAGAGYVGLVSVACYAQKRNLVSIYDNDVLKRETIASGRIPFSERNLGELLTKAMQAGRIKVVGDLAEAVAKSLREDCRQRRTP